MLSADIKQLNKDFDAVIESLALSLSASSSDESTQVLKIIDALRQNFQIMLRLDADSKTTQEKTFTSEDVSEIGDYALVLLDEVAANCASRGMQNEMLQLHRLSLPVVLWLNQHGGQAKKLDIVVNAIASYANTLQEPQQLESLCELISKVIETVDGTIKQDLELSNPVRPWKILNLNWGIVATRSHNTELMRVVFNQLIKNIPADAQQFFNEGMQQMTVVNYPETVRSLMQEYAHDMGEGRARH